MADAILAQSGIYAITNTINGKRYIGSAIHIGRRWIRHRAELARGSHHSSKLQKAWIKYGLENLRFEILEVVAEKGELLGREQFWIDRENSSVDGYNIRCTAGSMLGQKHTAATIEKCRAAKVGIVFSAEHKAKLSAWQVGSKQSEETKTKRSASLKGRPRSAEFVAKMTGRKQSQESIEKRRASMTGKKRTMEQIERIRQGQIGKKLSPESIAKRTATAKANRAARAASST